MIVREKVEVISPAFLIGCLKEHAMGIQRMDALASAYSSRPKIMNRVVTTGMPNNKLVHNYGRYIVAVSSGYLVGNPVNYRGERIDDILEAYAAARVDSVDAELAKDAALFGKGVELCYANEKAEPSVATLDPRTAFVVYSNDVASTPLLGIRAYGLVGEDGTDAGVEVLVYTDTEVHAYRGANNEQAVKTVPVITPHFFGGVPMVEYWNNDDETGDFEHISTLIDAYDLLQSDRLNDKEQLVQSILVMTGARMEDEPDELDENGRVKRRGRTAAEQIRQDKMLFLPDADATAHYLTKSLTESDVEVLKESIKADIHKFSMIPDLSDVNFAGNASGVAMRYKLFGLEQLTKVKERWFKEALRERLKLFAHFLSVKGKAAIDPNEVDIVFRRALPANEMELAQMVSTLNGMVPAETLLAQLPFIDDSKAAKAELDNEKAEGLKRQQMAFNAPFGGNDGLLGDEG